MKAQQKRATIDLDAEPHNVLRLKAAGTDRTISEIVNRAVKEVLAEDAEWERERHHRDVRHPLLRRPRHPRSAGEAHRALPASPNSPARLGVPLVPAPASLRFSKVVNRAPQTLPPCLDAGTDPLRWGDSLDSAEASLYFPLMVLRRKEAGSHAGYHHPHTRSRRPKLAQQAKTTLRRVRFSSGTRLGPIELSPQLTGAQQRALEYWIRRLPAPILARLPRLKLAVTERLEVVRENLFIEEVPRLAGAYFPGWTHTHAASFIPERYVALHQALFRRRVEMGRILYHELCHFLWPRLGNPKRRSFESRLQQEWEGGIRGELGYSAGWRKEKLRAGDQASLTPLARRRRWREYVCESFCDTGSYVLLGRERRPRHSEYTLSRSARERRSALWSALLLAPQQSVEGEVVLWR